MHGATGVPALKHAGVVPTKEQGQLMFWLPMAVLIALEILMKVGYAIQTTAQVKIPPSHIMALV